MLIEVALEEGLMELVKGVWQILNASQQQEREFKTVDDLIQELQVRGVITAFSQQPDDGSVTAT